MPVVRFVAAVGGYLTKKVLTDPLAAWIRFSQVKMIGLPELSGGAIDLRLEVVVRPSQILTPAHIAFVGSADVNMFSIGESATNNRMLESGGRTARFDYHPDVLYVAEINTDPYDTVYCIAVIHSNTHNIKKSAGIRVQDPHANDLIYYPDFVRINK